MSVEMTVEKLIDYQGRLKLTTWKMAALVGADPRRYRRWLSGELPIGLYVSILLPLIVKIYETPGYEALIDEAFIGTTWTTDRVEGV